MPNLTVTIIQKDLLWEDPAANRQALETMILSDTSSSQLIVLPEMFTTGFSMKPKLLAEKMNGLTSQWMQNLAHKTNKTITGSLIIEEGGHYYNRLLWTAPNQPHQSYDKRHLFSYGNENEHYTPGKKILETQINNWKIRPLICYDLRFPVWSRNTTDYDILIYVANWPERRIAHWRSLLIARAIENQCFVIATNRVGTDGNGIYHNGNSMIISPKGQVLLEVTDCECIESITLFRNNLDQYRSDFPALKDKIL